MTNDIVLNKKESIERCIRQIRLYYTNPSKLPFIEDHYKQDAIAINLQRAAEQCIDLANHVVREKHLGLPKESRESFDLLVREQLITPELGEKLMKMVGFRNILIHEYQELDITLMQKVIENHLDDLIDFTNLILRIPE